MKHAAKVCGFSLLVLLFILGEPSTQAAQENAKRQNSFQQIEAYAPQILSEHAGGSISVGLPEGHEFTEGIPLEFRVGMNPVRGATSNGVKRLQSGAESAGESILKEGALAEPARELPVEFDIQKEIEGDSVLEVDLEVPYCTTASPRICKFKSVKLIQPISFRPEGKSKLELHAQIQ